MKKKGGIVFPVILLLFGIFLLIEARNIPPSFYQQVGAEQYSRVIAIILIVTGLYNLLTEMGTVRQTIVRLRSRAKGEATVPFYRDRAKFLLFMFFILLPLYALAVSTVGYFTSTAVFLITGMALIAREWKKKIWIILSLSIGLTIVMFFVFEIFKIYLPESLLI